MKRVLSIFFVLSFSYSVCKSQSWIRTDSLHTKQLNLSRYDSALYFAEETAAIVRGLEGENTINYAKTLNNLAVSHFYLGNFKKAKFFVLKEIVLLETLKATNNANYICALENASIICRKCGNHEESLDWIKKTEKHALRIYGFNKIEYANILVSFAGVYADMGSSANDAVFLRQAELYYKKAEDIYKKYNDNYSRCAEIINKSNLASYYNNSGNSPSAESLFLEIISNCETEYGKLHLFYAVSLNNLAVFYYNRGNYKQAEKYFSEAVDVCKLNNSANTIAYATFINNLGALYIEMGNYELATKMIISAKEIMEKSNMKQHKSYAYILNNLASDFLLNDYYSNPENKSKERIATSGELLFKADTIFQNNCQMPNADGAAIKNNIAVWYSIIGDKKKSLQLMYDLTMQSNISFSSSISLINKMGISSLVSQPDNNESHSILEPELIAIKVKMSEAMINEEALQNNEGTQSVTTRLLLKMIVGKANKIKNTLGPYHPTYAELLKSFIPLYKSIGAYDMEEQLTLDLINIINYNTLQDFSFLSESEKDFYYQTRLPDIHSFLAYTFNRKERNPAITGNTYNFVLQNKGLMLKSSTAMRLLILNSNDSILLKKYDEWLLLKKEISNLYATPVEMRTKDVEIETNKANALEKDLIQSSQAFGDFRKDLQVTWQNVQENLKPNEAAIEFINFKVKEKDGGNKVLYCALIIKKDSEYPQMVQLFEEKQLTAILSKLKENQEFSVKSVYGSKQFTETKLYDLIWKPLEQYLKGIEIINYSPSGLLHKVSFAALSNATDNYLVDNYQLNMLTSTAIVAKPKQSLFDKNSTVTLFGGIDYSINDTTFSPWNYLEGTLSETNQLNSTLEKQGIKVNYIKAKLATKQEFKIVAANSNIIHIASHGFFFPEPEKIKTEDNKTNNNILSRSASRLVMLNYIGNDNPLMRSGLIFAGVNDYWNGITDDIDGNGVLTALEVINIDLRKNKLVVLSACETGLGDIKDGEGVYGLQRAFKMAGTENLIMSLWKVPDYETAEFMKIFYGFLFIEHNINQAFTETQNLMRKKYDPYYWAAFVLVR